MKELCHLSYQINSTAYDKVVFLLQKNIVLIEINCGFSFFFISLQPKSIYFT